jgi:hypothetical protein
MDGNNFGGKKLANQVWATAAISTAVTASNNTLTAAIALKAPINNPGFTGTVTGITATMVGLGNVTNESKATMFSGPTFTGTATGTFSGPLTGNVTGNVSGTSGSTTGNAATATKLAATKNINSVAFDGSADISVNTLVNGTKTVTLASGGNLTLPASSDISVVSGFLTLNNSLQIGQGGVLLNKDNATWALYGQNTDPGTIITLPGLADATAGTPLSLRNDFSGGIELQGTTTVSGPLATTNDVTVGGNANISTLPTLPIHATNKKYVDARSVAISIAMS